MLTELLPQIGVSPAQPSKPIRLGIVGCGYVTVMSHLPASRLVPDVEVVALADLQLSLASELAQQFDVPLRTADYRDLFGKVDAVIVAVPHHKHASVALDFINRGIHVLVEKPMAVSSAECIEMIAAVERLRVKLAVGYVRRYYDSNRLVKRMVDTRFLGPVLRFEAEDAVLFDNFRASAFTVLPPAGGVLLDTGPHVLDLLLWWLGDFGELRYWDDAMGGVEANCRIEATTMTGVPGVVELSRTRRLGNRVRLYCQRGTVEVSTLDPTQVFVDSDLFTGPVTAARVVDADHVRDLTPYFGAQLSDFAGAILNAGEPCVPGGEGLRSVAAIERCKRSRQAFSLMPWMELNENIIRRVES